MSKISTYAPVAVFELQDQNGLSGIAAPRSGLAPCLIRLSSDDTPIAFGRATRLNPAAETRGLRQGWCGFEIAGLRQAFAVGDDVRLSCGVSGETLAQLPFDPGLFSPEGSAPRTLTTLDLTRLARGGEMCASVGDLMPFALAHYRTFGERAFIEASYQTLLRRWPESSAPGCGDADSGNLEMVVAAWLYSLADSDEFLNLWAAEIPGPFHQAFRYDRSLLG